MVTSMKDLYNSTIIQKEWYHRPLDATKGELLKNLTGIGHQGVVVTISSGERYLIHIVPEKKAVITDAKNMSSKWTVKYKTKKCKVSVAKVMKAVEQLGTYSLPFNNCYDAAQVVYDTD